MTFTIKFNKVEEENKVEKKKEPLPIDHKKFSEEFCKMYYDKMGQNGYMNVLPLFMQNAKCTFDGVDYNGIYNLLVKLSQKNVNKFLYHTITAESQLIGNDVLISSSGSVTPLSFSGAKGKSVKFTETFVLCKSENTYYIRNYIVKYFD